MMEETYPKVPGFQFVDHVAIAVKQGELDPQVAAYRAEAGTAPIDPTSTGG